MSALKIVTAREWSGRKTGPVFPTHAAKGIVIHHTAGNNRPPKDAAKELTETKRLANQIRADHMQRNRWRDSGHSFLVTRGGIIAEGRWGTVDFARRGLVVQGAHSGDEANRDHWGIEVEGNFETGDPTEEQIDALIELCAWLSFWGKTQAADLSGHREHTATLCPGERLYRMLPGLRTAVRDRKLQIMQAEGGG